MAITLCQSLGQNLGMMWNKDRATAGETPALLNLLLCSITQKVKHISVVINDLHLQCWFRIGPSVFFKAVLFFTRSYHAHKNTFKKSS